MRFEIIKNIERLQFILMNDVEMFHFYCVKNANMNIIAMSIKNKRLKNNISYKPFIYTDMCAYIIKFYNDQDNIFFNKCLRTIIEHIYEHKTKLHFLTNKNYNIFKLLCKDNNNINFSFPHVSIAYNLDVGKNRRLSDIDLQIINDVRNFKLPITVTHNLITAIKLHKTVFLSNDISDNINDRFGINLIISESPYKYKKFNKTYIKLNLLYANLVHLTHLCYDKRNINNLKTEESKK